MASKFSLGVDLIELKRAKAFYLAHRDRLPASVKKSRKPVEALAFYLAKKEAMLKARKKSHLGFTDFKYFKSKKFVAVSCAGI